MKIVVFDWEDSTITVVPLTDAEEQDMYVHGDEHAADILATKGFEVNNYSINWMIVDTDLPVYNYNDSIPFIAL